MTTEYTAAKNRAHASLAKDIASKARCPQLCDALEQATATNEKLWGKIAEALERARFSSCGFCHATFQVLREALPSDYQESKE